MSAQLPDDEAVGRDLRLLPALVGGAVAACVIVAAIVIAIRIMSRRRQESSNLLDQPLELEAEASTAEPPFQFPKTPI
jgi:hypothetical protein